MRMECRLLHDDGTIVIVATLDALQSGGMRCDLGLEIIDPAYEYMWCGFDYIPKLRPLPSTPSPAAG